MKEDKLTNALINFWKQYQNSELYPEAHYNYYGTRGIADLHYRDDSDRLDIVVEVKSNLGNANETIRQFNKMEKYFFKDPSRNAYRDRRFELTIIPSDKNLRHLAENSDMYSSIEGYVTFRHPDNTKPIHVFEVDSLEAVKGENKPVFDCLSSEEVEYFDKNVHKANRKSANVNSQSLDDRETELVRKLTKQGCMVDKDVAGVIDEDVVSKILELDQIPMYVNSEIISQVKKEVA